MTNASTSDFLGIARKCIEAFAVSGIMPDLTDLDAARARLSPWQVVWLDPMLRKVFADKTFREKTRRSGGWIPSLRKEPGLPSPALMRSDPRSALVLAHSNNGYVRERATTAMPIRSDDAAAMALLLLRCNDWVGPVRAMALQKLRDVLPSLDAPQLAPICLFVHQRVRIWGRGGAEAADVVMAHPKWSEALLINLMQAVDGPLAQTLRQALRTPELDIHLSRLASDAKSAFVRAVATQAVLEGCARWPVGTEWRWVDRSMGKKKRRTIFNARTLDVDAETVTRIVRAAAHDKATNVRKLAADRAIADGPSIGPDLVQSLRADPTRAVAERMDYYERKWADSKPSDKRNYDG